MPFLVGWVLDEWVCKGHWQNNTERKNRSTRRKTSPVTTNPTWA